MKLPNIENIEVPLEKILSYLLNTAHHEGGGKAIFFLHVGFSVERWENMVQALISHAQEHDVVKDEITDFGIRYVIEGPLMTPNNRIVQIRSVWFIRHNENHPRLVTAYPLEEQV